MARLANGSEVYFLDPETKQVVQVQCATSFNPGGAPRDAVDNTCLEDDFSSSLPGTKQNAQATLNINADDRYESHGRLYDIYDMANLEEFPWVIGWPGSRDKPTVNEDGTDFELPDTRTWYAFNAYPTDVPFDHESNALITAAITLQRSGPAKWIRAAKQSSSGNSASSSNNTEGASA